MLTKIAPESPYRPSVLFGAVCVFLGLFSGGAAGYFQSVDPSLHLIGHNLSLWIGLAVLAASRGNFIRAVLLAVATLICSVFAYYAISYLHGRVQYGGFPADFVMLWGFIAVFAGIFFAILSLNLVQGGRRGGVALGVYIGLFYGDAIQSYGITQDAWWRVFTVVNVVSVVGVLSIIAMLGILAISGRLTGIRGLWSVLGLPLGVLCALAPPLALSVL